MKRLRLSTILLTGWLIGFYILVHYWEPISLSRIIFLYLLVLAVLIMTIPRLSHRHLFWLLTVPSLVFYVIKDLMNYHLAGSALPITIIETCAIIFTTLLLLWVRGAIYEFESLIAAITLGYREKGNQSGINAQSVLYREVRRARNHQRPLAMMAIGVEESSIKGALSRMVKEAQQNVIKQFTLSSVSNVLCEKLEDCDIVVQANNHFLVVLPETRPVDLPGLMERLKNQVAEQVGVELKFGTASLPEDGFTYEGLLDKATLEMQAALESKLYIEREQLFVRNKAQSSISQE